MRELLALTGRHLRTSARSRSVRAACIVLALGLCVAAWAGHAMPSASLVLLGGLFVVLLVVTGFAVGAGTVLPDDRVAGREAWLATLMPPAWKRRLAVVLAGWLLAVGIGTVGGALAGVAAVIARDDVAPRAWRRVPLPEARMLGGATPLTVTLPADARAGEELELDVRPLIRGLRLIDAVTVTWSTETGSGRLRVPVRGPIRLVPPAGSRTVGLAILSRNVRLRLVDARMLGATRPAVPSLAWVGLLLGLCAGAVAPVAVLLSRATTGQTAAAGAFSLLLLGAAKEGMRDLAARLDPVGLDAVVPIVLEAFAFLAPDAPVFAVLADATALRMPSPDVVAALVPTLAYTVVVSVLASVSAPAFLRAGVNT